MGGIGLDCRVAVGRGRVGHSSAWIELFYDFYGQGLRSLSILLQLSSHSNSTSSLLEDFFLLLFFNFLEQLKLSKIFCSGSGPHKTVGVQTGFITKRNLSNKTCSKIQLDQTSQQASFQPLSPPPMQRLSLSSCSGGFR